MNLHKQANLQADAHAEASRKALDAINQTIRSEGRRLQDFRISDRRRAAAALVASDPKWLEAAAARCAKFKTFARKRSR
jgi:hypothetical protein